MLVFKRSLKIASHKSAREQLHVSLDRKKIRSCRAEIRVGCIFGHGRICGPRWRITIPRLRFFRQITVENLRKRLVNGTLFGGGSSSVIGFCARCHWSLRDIVSKGGRSKRDADNTCVSLLLCARDLNAQDLPSGRRILRFYDDNNRVWRIPGNPPTILSSSILTSWQREFFNALKVSHWRLEELN